MTLGRLSYRRSYILYLASCILQGCSTGSFVLCISCNVIGAFRDVIKHRFGFLQDYLSSGAVYFLLHHLHIVSLSEILGLLKWIQVLSTWSSRYKVLLSPFHLTVLATTDDHWTKSIISLQASKWCFSKSVKLSVYKLELFCKELSSLIDYLVSLK